MPDPEPRLSPTHADVGRQLVYAIGPDGELFPLPATSDGHVKVYVVNPGGGGEGGTTDVSALAKEATLLNVLTEVGEPVELAASTRADLKIVSVENLPALDADGGLLVHVLNPSGGGGPSTVALDAATLAALETITMANPTPATDVSALAKETTLQGVAKDASVLAVRDRLPAALDGSGNFKVALPGTQPVSLATAPVTPVTDNGGSLTVDGGFLTNTELRASAVPVSTGLTPLTDTQLRASAVPVSGPLTDTQLRAAAVPVSGPLTDIQLRATAVPTKALPNATTWVSAAVAGPAANAVIVTTGNLPAGDYDLFINMAVSPASITAAAAPGAIGQIILCQHLNAADAVIQTYAGCPDGAAVQLELPRVTIALNEEIRVVNGPMAGPATNSRFVAAIGRRLA